MVKTIRYLVRIYYSFIITFKIPILGKNDHRNPPSTQSYYYDKMITKVTMGTVVTNGNLLSYKYKERLVEPVSENGFDYSAFNSAIKRISIDSDISGDFIHLCVLVTEHIFTVAGGVRQQRILVQTPDPKGAAQYCVPAQFADGCQFCVRSSIHDVEYVPRV